MDASDIKGKPWAKQPNETAKAYAAFVIYLELGKDRSIAKALERSGQTAGNQRYWETWSSNNDWWKRAEAYDSDRLMDRIAGRVEVRERGVQTAVDATQKLMGHVLSIANGKMPEGDREIVCDRTGKPQEVTIEGAFGIPIEVAMTRPLISPKARLEACVYGLGVAGIVVVKKQEITGREGDDIRIAMRGAVSNLDPEIKAGLLALFDLIPGD